MDTTLDQLRARLTPFAQEHILAFWHELEPAQRSTLASHIGSVDLKQIESLVKGDHRTEDWAELARRASAPPAFRLNGPQGNISSSQAIDRGEQALMAGHLGVVVVAGGQGTRLGFQHPKGIFSIGPISGASLFQVLLEKILARSRAANATIPLYLMTSPATHEETVAYLRQQKNFGLADEDVRVFCQGTMPAVDAASGRLLLGEKHELAISPDGHGGLLQAMSANDCWGDIRRRGLRQLFYCQVDNPLVQMCDPQFLGYHLLSNSELSTQVVAKRGLRDKVGNVVAIDDSLRIIEYSDLNPLSDEIIDRRGPGGTPIFWAGNTAIHVFDVAFLERMAQSGTALPFHVAKKAVAHCDSAGQKVEPNQENAIKFERFIFDLLPAARHAIVVEVDESQAFAPVKNAPGDKRDTPESTQAQMIALHSAWLRAAGCEVAPGVAVEISPLFAQNAQELAARVEPGLVVTQPRYFC